VKRAEDERLFRTIKSLMPATRLTRRGCQLWFSGLWLIGLGLRLGTPFSQVFMLALSNTVWKEHESAMFLPGHVSTGFLKIKGASLASIMRIASLVSNGLSNGLSQSPAYIDRTLNELENTQNRSPPLLCGASWTPIVTISLLTITGQPLFSDETFPIRSSDCRT